MVGLSLRPFPIREQIDEVVSSIQSLIVDKALDLAIEGDAGISVLGDPIMFQEILMNILQNAAKFSDKGGSIQISVLEGREMVSTVVSDHAGGIPEEVLRGLSMPIFQRADKKQLREVLDRATPKGFNLGLHISQELPRLCMVKCKQKDGQRELS